MKTMKIVVAAALTVLASTSLSATPINSAVERIIQDSDRWGQCAIRLEQSVAGTCGTNLISFDCEGQFNDPNFALNMLDTAVFALATNRQLNVVIAPEQQINGACVAKRVTVVK